MKQRIIIVTKFYYRRGGDCVCALNLEKLLRERGHEVAGFAMRYPENLTSEWESYWPEEVDFGGPLKSKLAALKRTMGLGDVADKFKRLLKDFRPDVVHLHNIHSYLSPVVAKLAKKYGARVVWTLHDYKLLCPSYSCLRNGEVCELCFNDKKKVLSTRCMKGSLAASALAYMEALRWNAKRLQSYTDLFICPSEFMASKMKQGGFAPGKLAVLCNFIAPEMLEKRSVVSEDARGDYYCYIGRLSEEKGVRALLEAASRLPMTLKVAGSGPLDAELRGTYAGKTNIEFLGQLSSDGVRDLLAHAKFSVMPSECYENNPLGVIESLCMGTPVVGAEIGGIPELIDNPGSGAEFKSGSVDDLVSKISEMWSGKFDYATIADNSCAVFGADRYYISLLDKINILGGGK